MRVADDVAGALADGRPVVALESTILAHGLPPHRSLEVAHACEGLLRESGVVPATIAVLERSDDVTYERLRVALRVSKRPVAQMHRLAKRGLVELAEGSNGTVVRLTAAGRAKLDGWLMGDLAEAAE
jgi:pseudouridine-5'-phosphate glycosidase